MGGDPEKGDGILDMLPEALSDRLARFTGCVGRRLPLALGGPGSMVAFAGEPGINCPDCGRLPLPGRPVLVPASELRVEPMRRTFVRIGTAAELVPAAAAPTLDPAMSDGLFFTAACEEVGMGGRPAESRGEPLEACGLMVRWLTMDDAGDTASEGLLPSGCDESPPPPPPPPTLPPACWFSGVAGEPAAMANGLVLANGLLAVAGRGMLAGVPAAAAKGDACAAGLPAAAPNGLALDTTGDVVEGANGLSWCCAAAAPDAAAKGLAWAAAAKGLP